MIGWGDVMRFNLRKRVVFFQVPPYKKRWVRSCLSLGMLLLISTLSFYMVDFRIRPTLIQLARVTAHKIAIQAINESIQANIASNLEYCNLMRIQTNSEGRVTLMQPNTGKINKITSVATMAVQKRLQNLPEQEVTIPVWQAFGSKILAGSGPKIPVRIFPVGIVESAIHDQFDQAGINQTRHRIFIRVKVNVRIVVPLVTEEVEAFSDIPLTEAIIVGEVPDVFVHGASGVIIPGNGTNGSK